MQKGYFYSMSSTIVVNTVKTSNVLTIPLALEGNGITFNGGPLPGPTIASQVQAETGTDNTVYMTPLRTAEAIVAQTPAIASQAQAEAGTDNTVVMTPLRTAEAIAAQVVNPFVYRGNWNATTNTPTLADGTGTSGWTYRVSVGGTIDLGSGPIEYEINDKVVHNGTTWEKWDVQDDDSGEVGSYKFFAGDTPGSGYILAEGQLEDPAEYPRLFNYLGTKYGGNGTTTFGIPDARGLVMVGAGNHGTMTRANGTPYGGGSVGATRNDQMQGHRHEQWAALQSAGPGSGSYAFDSTQLTPTSLLSRGADAIRAAITDGTNGTPRTGDETRPAEIAVLVCIKY